ncbi:MAG: hypothetical protein II183_00085 [Elusimicrobiaceae bacterium]|nr:hypothetical protein [Elusimicrobiaceae bacterium]
MELAELYNKTKEPFVVLFNKSVDLLPGIIGALLMLFLGLLLSRWTSTLTKALLTKFKLDESTEKIGVNELLSRIGLGKSPTYVLTFVFSWAVMIIFIMLAADFLHLPVISIILEKFLLFIPKLIACIIILFAGAIFGRFVERLVLNSARANKVRGGVFIARIVNIVVLVFAVLLALQQININFVLINQVIVIVLASLGLGFGLALGLGAKGVVEDYLRDLVKENDEEEKKAEKK